MARLVGKLANINPDLPNLPLADTSVIKALTGGDLMTGELKHRDSFEFKPFAKLMFSANEAPLSADSSYGFSRRWLVVPFSRLFEDGARGTLPREKLDARLSNPKELSGLLNRALDVLPGVLKNGFRMSASLKRAAEEFRRDTNPLNSWLDTHVVPDPAGFVPMDRLLDAYNEHCKTLQRPFITRTGLGLALNSLLKVGKAQRTVDREPKTWVYTGIRLVSRKFRFFGP